MKKTKMMFHALVSFIFFFVSTGYSLIQADILMGTIQYPQSIRPSKTSSLPIIYNCGKKISILTHDVGIPKITYEISKGKDQTKFYILISTDIEWSIKKTLENEAISNTIDHLTISPEKPYKFFVCELIQDISQEKTSSTTCHWEISEQQLPDGKIPDTTIIIRYFPEAIKTVRGGSNIELPTIILDNSMLELFGSIENLKEESIKLQMSSLNSDSIHSPMRQKMKIEQGRLLIVQTIA